MGQKEGTNENRFYFDLSDHERESAIRYLLGSIISSRQKWGFPSNYYTFDEDVNIYLAHLLFAASLPEYHELSEPYLSAYSSDLLTAVRNTEDRTIRYFIFKVNADHILLHTAIFEDLPSKAKQKFFKRAGEHYTELGKVYYEQAASYHKRIYQKQTGVGDVLSKLAHHFEAYQQVFKHVRSEYFDFVNNFRDQAFKHFVKEVQNYEKKALAKEKMNQFLDLYGRWLETKNPVFEEKISEMAREIHELDPDFNFDVKRELHGGGGPLYDKKCA